MDDHHAVAVHEAQGKVGRDLTSNWSGRESQASVIADSPLRGAHCHSLTELLASSATMRELMHPTKTARRATQQPDGAWRPQIAEMPILRMIVGLRIAVTILSRHVVWRRVLPQRPTLTLASGKSRSSSPPPPLTANSANAARNQIPTVANSTTPWASAHRRRRRSIASRCLRVSPGVLDLTEDEGAAQMAECATRQRGQCEAQTRRSS